MESPLLVINNLSVQFVSEGQATPAVKNVSFSIQKGKTLGLVGESGSGKSVTSLATMGLLSSPPAEITNGEILFEGRDLLKMSEKEMQGIRGNRISMIFQEPMTSLNPVFTVGYQVVEALKLHQKLSNKQAWQRATELLDEVGIPNPEKRVKAYPHEMSGGQRQRVMIAMAIACQPDLLIADEPTTALDVTIQKQILDLLKKLQNQYQMSLLFITHDLGVIGDIADDVLVMYKGQLVEQGPVRAIFNNPKHPYTKGLLACRPPMNSQTSRLAMLSDFMDNEGKEKTFDIKKLGERKPKVATEGKPLLEVKGIRKYYPSRKGFLGYGKEWVRAVDGVSFQVQKGQTLGLVGESGCGKTTLGRTILRLLEPTEGEVYFDGLNLTSLKPSQMRSMRQRIQIIFQDPYASLNPRMTIGSALIEPMAIHQKGAHSKERYQRAVYLLEKVGLTAQAMERYPHEFSGGQRQRICIARALTVEPEFILCDESVSALDVSIQAQILNLLMDLQDEMNLTYIFISHDLAVVRFISDDVAVMKDGKIIEKASALDIYNNPQNPYTQKLLSSIPVGL